jgi:hypothetical protein
MPFAAAPTARPTPGCSQPDNALGFLIRSHLKNASANRWRRCPPLNNAQNLARLLRVFIGGRLALGLDLRFLRWLLFGHPIGCGDGSYSMISRTARLLSFAEAALMMVRMAWAVLP